MNRQSIEACRQFLVMFCIFGLVASGWALTVRVGSLETQLRHHQMAHGQQEALQQLISDGVVPEGSALQPIETEGVHHGFR